MEHAFKLLKKADERNNTVHYSKISLSSFGKSTSEGATSHLGLPYNHLPWEGLVDTALRELLSSWPPVFVRCDSGSIPISMDCSEQIIWSNPLRDFRINLQQCYDLSLCAEGCPDVPGRYCRYTASATGYTQWKEIYNNPQLLLDPKRLPPPHPCWNNNSWFCGKQSHYCQACHQADIPLQAKPALCLITMGILPTCFLQPNCVAEVSQQVPFSLSCLGMMSLRIFVYTPFLPRGKARLAPAKAAIILPLDGLARSGQDPVNHGHGAQHWNRPPPTWAGIRLSRFVSPARNSWLPVQSPLWQHASTCGKVIDQSASLSSRVHPSSRRETEVCVTQRQAAHYLKICHDTIAIESCHLPLWAVANCTSWPELSKTCGVFSCLLQDQGYFPGWFTRVKEFNGDVYYHLIRTREDWFCTSRNNCMPKAQWSLKHKNPCKSTLALKPGNCREPQRSWASSSSRWSRIWSQSMHCFNLRAMLQ